MTTLLAGDIGGTKTLLALYRLGPAGELVLLRQQRYVSADWPELTPVLQAFLGLDGSGAAPAAACLAVAGPVQGGRARLTNLPWQLEESRLKAGTGIARLELVNDFAVLVHGLAHLAPHQQAPVRPGQAEAGAPVLVLGAGTGLGVAFGVPSASGLVAMATEAAHGEFAPRSGAEWQLKQWLAQDRELQRVSIERVVSGTGLGDLCRWLLAREDQRDVHPLAELAARWRQGEVGSDLPAAVASAAADGDPLAREALELWLGAYGSVAGDLALAGLSRGGVWLAGGTAARLLEPLRSATFQRAFLAKGRLRPVLEPMPIQALVDPAIGSFSAACRARELLQRWRRPEPGLA